MINVYEKDDCNQCMMLKKILSTKMIGYQTFNIQVLVDRGFDVRSAPMMENEKGELMDYNTALVYIRSM